jgi:hypothetical protein
LKRGDRIRVSARPDGDAISSADLEEIVLGNAPPGLGGIEGRGEGGATLPLRGQDPDGDRSLRWSLAQAPRA